MSTIHKIYLTLIVWLVFTASVFLYGFPKLADGLIRLQASHQEQIDTRDKLIAQALALEKMKKDLQALQNESIQSSDFFTSDTKLVNEIKYIEGIAQSTSTDLTISISGSADKAAEAVGTKSKLAVVPYTIGLEGAFQNTLNFMKYLENSYFISPVNGLSITADEAGLLTTRILTNFYIYK